MKLSGPPSTGVPHVVKRKSDDEKSMATNCLRWRWGEGVAGGEARAVALGAGCFQRRREAVWCTEVACGAVAECARGGRDERLLAYWSKG
jgi:hypothetical protein